jgi:hypothetical protein
MIIIPTIAVIELRIIFETITAKRHSIISMSLPAIAIIAAAKFSHHNLFSRLYLVSS